MNSALCIFANYSARTRLSFSSPPSHQLWQLPLKLAFESGLISHDPAQVLLQWDQMASHERPPIAVGPSIIFSLCHDAAYLTMLSHKSVVAEIVLLGCQARLALAPSTSAISSAVKPYKSYTSASISASVASIWRWKMVFCAADFAAAICLCNLSIESTSFTMRSCRDLSVGLERSIVRIGSVSTYCFVQVFQPPRKTLLMERNRQNRSLEFNNPKT